MYFEKMKFDNIDLVKTYFEKYNKGYNYNTVGGFFAWRDWLSTEFCIEDEMMFMKVKGKRNGDLFCLPMANDVECALKKLIEYVKQNDLKLRLFPVDNEELSFIDKYFDYDKREMDGGDYIYDFNTLKNMSGRKLHGQKNHLNYFAKTFPNAKIIKADTENVKELLDFIQLVKNVDKEKNVYMYKDEIAYNEEVINNFDKYGYDGVIAKIDSKIIGFVLGEEIKETAFLHIMKIDKNYRGVAQFLITEYLKFIGKDLKYVNMEDDAGDEDLKYTKNCYHPLVIEKPYVIDVKEYKI